MSTLSLSNNTVVGNNTSNHRLCRDSPLPFAPSCRDHTSKVCSVSTHTTTTTQLCGGGGAIVPHTPMLTKPWSVSAACMRLRQLQYILHQAIDQKITVWIPYLGGLLFAKVCGHLFCSVEWSSYTLQRMILGGKKAEVVLF